MGLVFNHTQQRVSEQPKKELTPQNREFLKRLGFNGGEQ
jgi:hypothetical protein